MLSLLLAASLLTSAPWQIYKTESDREEWRFIADDADIADGGWVHMSFTASWKGIVKKRPFYAWSGIIFAASAVDEMGKKLFLKTINLGDGSRSDAPGKMKFLLPRNSRKFTITFGPKFATGAFSLRNTEIDLMPFDSRYPSIIRGGKSYEYAERGKEPSAPAQVAKEDVFAVFGVDSPRMTFDRFAPEKTALANRFSLVAAPGETANLFIGLVAGADCDVAAKIGPFAAKNGGMALADCAALYRAHNRTNNAGRGQTYWIAPEVLVPFSEMPAVKAGGSAMTLLQFKLPKDAKPGVYEGAVVYSAGGVTRKADVRLSVLPIAVPYPEPKEYQQILHISWYADDPAVLEKLCRDARSRGCESLLITCQYGKGMLELERRGGRIAIRSFNRFEHALAAFKASGMRGTLFVHFSDKLEVAVAKALGVSFPDGKGEQTKIVPEMHTAEFKAAQVEALKLVKDRCGGISFAIMAMDEPDNADRLPRTLWEMDRIREAGLTSALYAGASSYDKSHPDIIISQITPGTPIYDHFRKETARHGALLCRYGGSGSYGFAFGGLMPSRLLHGWGEYLMPECKGHTIWMVGVDTPYDPGSTEHFRSYPSVYQRTGDGRLLSTLQLEGCYEGYLDYAYLKELDRRLAARAGSPEAKRIAEEFNLLKQEMAGVVPYRLNADFVPDPEKEMKRRFTNADATAVRRKIARWICELQ